MTYLKMTGGGTCDDCGIPLYSDIRTGEIVCGCSDVAGGELFTVPDYLKWKECPQCKGTGFVGHRPIPQLRYTNRYVCPECNGHQEVRESPYLGWSELTKEKEETI